MVLCALRTTVDVASSFKRGSVFLFFLYLISFLASLFVLAIGGINTLCQNWFSVHTSVIYALFIFY